MVYGFALGLRVALRHPARKEGQDPSVLHLKDSTDAPYNVTLNEDSDLVRESFGSVRSSIETLLFALVGTFDPEVASVSSLYLT